MGAHVQISKQHTNSTLMARVHSVTPLWSRLRLSACGYAQKIRALKCSAWPKGLHGVAAASLSFSTFKSLRSGAMKGIRADAAGANPMVHLGLIEAVDVNPLGWAILQTIRLTRDCGAKDNVRVFWLRLPLEFPLFHRTYHSHPEHPVAVVRMAC